MYDLIYLATIIGFFALCVAYIKACDRIINVDVDLELLDRDGADEQPAEQAA